MFRLEVDSEATRHVLSIQQFYTDGGNAYLVPAFESCVLGFRVEFHLRDKDPAAPFQSTEHREVKDLLPRGTRDHNVTHLRLGRTRDVQQTQLPAHSLQTHMRTIRCSR